MRNGCSGLDQDGHDGTCCPGMDRRRDQAPHCSRCPEIAQTKSTWTGTFRENGFWHGRSPGKTQDLPGKWPLAWKVPRKSAGPSGKMAPGMEGPPEKRRTFRENGSWHGRSPGKTQDLPGKRALAWKVPGKNAGPSGKMAPGMEGPPEKRRTFRENSPQRGRAPHLKGDLGTKKAVRPP